MAEEVETTDDGGTPPPDVDDVDPGTPPDGTGGEPDALTPPDDEDPEFSKFLAKHQGNRGAAAKHYFEVMGQNARFHKENQQLAARLREFEERDRAPHREEPPAPDPSVVELDQTIQALHEQLTKTLPAEENEIIKEHSKATRTEAFYEGKIQELESKLANGDTIDPVETRAEIRALKAEHRASLATIESIKTRYAIFTQRRDETVRNFRGAQQQRQHVTTESERRRAQERDVEARREQFNEEFPQYIDGLVDAAARDLEVDVDDYVRDIINARLVRTVAPYGKQGIQAEEIDWAACVREAVKAHKDHIEGRTRARLAAPRKVAATAPSQAQRPAQVPKSAASQDWNPRLGPKPEDPAVVRARIEQRNAAARRYFAGLEAKRTARG